MSAPKRSQMVRDFLAMVGKLDKLGVPAPSEWWLGHICRWLVAYERGEVLEFWACVGRGGAKSTVLYLLALFFSLRGDFEIPAAERHYAICMSRHRDEAAKGLAIIARWLELLGIPFHSSGDVLDIDGTNRGIRVVSASVTAASGWRCYWLGADEAAKWGSDGAVMLDAAEVLASARQMCATHANAPLMVCSSPWLDSGPFYDAITHGDGDGRIVAWAPSWVANPALITEEGTRKRERDERRWRREAKAEFSTEYSGGYFDNGTVLAATDTGRNPIPNGPTVQPGERAPQYVIAIDPAFSGDNYGIVIGHASTNDNRPRELRTKIVVDMVAALRPPKGGVLSPEETTRAVVMLRQTWPGPAIVYSDQHSATTLAEIFMRHGVHLVVEPWTADSKTHRFSLTRGLLVDGRLSLPDDPALRRELSGVGLKLSPGGHESITTKGAHDDRASALVHCVHVCMRYASDAIAGESATLIQIEVGQTTWGAGSALQSVDAGGSMQRDGSWRGLGSDLMGSRDPLGAIRALQRAHRQRDDAPGPGPSGLPDLLARAQRDASSWDSPLVTSYPTRGH
jgi:hypothetical protein